MRHTFYEKLASKYWVQGYSWKLSPWFPCIEENKTKLKQNLRNWMKETSLFVGILVFMSSWNFMLSWVEHEKSFITFGPGFDWYVYWSITVMHTPQRSCNHIDLKKNKQTETLLHYWFLRLKIMFTLGNVKHWCRKSIKPFPHKLFWVIVQNFHYPQILKPADHLKIFTT